MKLHDVVPAKGSRQERRRVGRGRATGQGKSAGRGTKGQNARAGKPPRSGFEGGQNPLTQRLPHMGGFKNPFRTGYAPVNLARLQGFSSGSTVDPQILAEAGIIGTPQVRVKVLAHGGLDRPLHIKAHAFSAAAKAGIEAAGGSWEVLEAV